MKNPQVLLDEFAGKAMQALITKMPFYDVEGEYGEKLTQEQLTEIKKGITKTSYEYASWMLIAREEQKEWLKTNIKLNSEFGE